MTPHPSFLIAVVIPHYNDTRRLVLCLAALEEQDRTEVEVVVSDNASIHSLTEVKERFPWVHFVVQTQKGAGPARNLGVEVTAARCLLFLDADCIVAPDWLENARRIAREHTQEITGGRVGVFDETPPPRSGAEAFETVFAFNQETYITKRGYSVTANLFVPRKIFEAVGPFASIGSEDVDWCRRATQAGFKLRYDAGLTVFHPTRATWPDLRHKWLRLTREGYVIAQRSILSRIAWSLRAVLMPLLIIVNLPRIIRHSNLSLGEKGKASITLVRLRFGRMVWMVSAMIRSKM